MASVISAQSLSSSMELMNSPFHENEVVFARIRVGGPWIRAKILRIFKPPGSKEMVFKIEDFTDNHSIHKVQKYHIARIQNHDVHLRCAKRVIAGPADSQMRSGMIGQEPHDQNDNRYLVLFDDATAKYVEPDRVYPIFGQQPCPWKDVQATNVESQEKTRAYIRNFCALYPERRSIDVKEGDSLEVYKDDEFSPTVVLGVDVDTIQVEFEDGQRESIHQNSPRLYKMDLMNSKIMNRPDNVQSIANLLVKNAHYYANVSVKTLKEEFHKFADREVVILGPKPNKAKKSTGQSRPRRFAVELGGRDIVEDRINIKALDHDLLEGSKSHKCHKGCLKVDGVKTEADVVDIVGEFRDEGDLKVPLLLGWRRELRKVPARAYRYRSKRFIAIVYTAPCGKIIIDPNDINQYLEATDSRMDTDYFSFEMELRISSKETVPDAIYYLENFAADKDGKPLENKYISVLNNIDEERLPYDFEYSSITTPHRRLILRNFSLNEEFKSSCDCDKNCSRRFLCDCQRLTEDSYEKHDNFRTYHHGKIQPKCQYTINKRLTSVVHTGIFECNSYCKCNSRCPNRVVQNGMRFRLQIRKTEGKGWGVVTLDAIPTGAYICTYTAELLDDADQYGNSDMYYADLDHVTVLEKQKLGEDEDEGLESDGEIVEVLESSSIDGQRKSCSARGNGSSSSPIALDSDSESNSESSHNNAPNKSPTETSSLRQPRFERIHKLLDSHEFTLDARSKGNVGRFFNHSCDPNAYVQNVFIESHDLRFPVIAFFSTKIIEAGDEITWNYNYQIGSVPGRELICRCKAPNCAGRIL